MFTENSKLCEVLKKNKNTASVFSDYGLYCMSCKGSAQDTVGMAALNHGLDLDSFLKDLNNAAKA